MTINPLRATSLLLVACLSQVAQSLLADPLSEIPEPYTATLKPVPEIGLESLDPESQDQLVAARQRVASALLAEPPAAELAEAWGELGALYQVQFVYSFAQTCYENAMQLAPDEFRWRYYSAYLAASTGELERALDDFEFAHRLRPGYLALTLRMADAWRDLNDLEQAEQAYRSVLDAEGLQAAAHFGLGQIALLRRDYLAAISYFRETLKLQPQASRVHYMLAQALRANGEPAAASEELAKMGNELPAFADPQIESLLALRQGSHIHFIRALKASRRQDFGAARDAFAEGLEHEPDNVNARISYARSLYLTGDRTAARTQLERVLQLDSNSALAQFLLGVLSAEAGDGGIAEQYFRTALQADPGHSGAHYYLGNVLYHKGRLEQAAEHYTRSIEAAKDNPGAYLALIGILLHNAEYDRAVELIGAAVQQYPELPVFGFLQLQLQAMSNDSSRVQQALERAGQLANEQNIPPHRELLALALSASGDFESAATVLQALAAELLWVMPAEGQRLERALQACRSGRLPAVADLFTWSLLQPPPVQGRAVFLSYPAPRPY